MREQERLTLPLQARHPTPLDRGVGALTDYITAAQPHQQESEGGPNVLIIICQGKHNASFIAVKCWGLRLGHFIILCRRKNSKTRKLWVL